MYFSQAWALLYRACIFLITHVFLSLGFILFFDIHIIFFKPGLHHACIFLTTHVFLSPGFITHVFFLYIHIYIDA